MHSLRYVEPWVNARSSELITNIIDIPKTNFLIDKPDTVARLHYQPLKWQRLVSPWFTLKHVMLHEYTYLT